VPVGIESNREREYSIVGALEGAGNELNTVVTKARVSGLLEQRAD
jgi:hypothetical protein